jgi:predicted amidohydrolase YtcJ
MDLADSDVAETGGFVDHHTHLLKDAARTPFPWQGTTVREFHQKVARAGTTPMDIAEPGPDGPPQEMERRLLQGLTRAARSGLVEVTEMGMRDWWYLDALIRLSEAAPLPARVRIYLACGLAESAGLTELETRRDAASSWIRLDGIKFYADGWLVPRTCALCTDYDDTEGNGLLFVGAQDLARRIEPFAAQGWRIATHAIGDRGIEAVLDAYELAWGRDRNAVAAAMPRIEHGSLQSAEIASRIAELGVTVCIQPSFAVTDAAQVPVALGLERAAVAYPWAALAGSGVNLLLGTDYPIEVLEPLVSLARLVSGRSGRPGFGTEGTAPPHSRLPLDVALRLATDAAAGSTFLSADPLAASPAELDQIEVRGTAPLPF